MKATCPLYTFWNSLWVLWFLQVLLRSKLTMWKSGYFACIPKYLWLLMETHLYVNCMLMQIHFCGFSQEKKCHTLEMLFRVLKKWFNKIIQHKMKESKQLLWYCDFRAVQPKMTSRKTSFLFIHIAVTRLVLLHASLVFSECTIFRECYWLCYGVFQCHTIPCLVYLIKAQECVRWLHFILIKTLKEEYFFLQI